MPKRIPKWLAGQSREHPIMATLVTVLIVAVPGYVVTQDQQADTEALVACNRAYAESLNAALAPRLNAVAELDRADARVWAAVDVVLSQEANPADYARLGRVVDHRRKVWHLLQLERAKHPLPETPAEFC
jgi:hypothetical protein